MSKFRKELKYMLNNNDFNILNHNLNNIIKKDENCVNDYYTISSIYFDTYNMTSYNQVKNGLSTRWKYRIRFYNYNDCFIKLEKKYKENNLTDKMAISITKEVLNKILNNSIKIDKNNPKLLNEFIIKMKTELLRPIICIEYDRIPYTYKAGNVRITLDYNIRYTNRFDDIFNKNKKIKLIEGKILEVKYDDFIPDFIRYRLELNHLEQVSFSKFSNCIDDLYRRY